MSPAQTTANKVEFYRVGDTAPDLERQLIDGNEVPYGLDGANVFLTLAPVVHSILGSFAYPTVDTLLYRSPCRVMNQNAYPGWVAWTPGVDELSQAGAYGLYFEIEWPDGRWQSISPKSFKPLVVNPKPGYSATPAAPTGPDPQEISDLEKNVRDVRAEVRVLETRINSLMSGAADILFVDQRTDAKPVAGHVGQLLITRDDDQIIAYVDRNVGTGLNEWIDVVGVLPGQALPAKTQGDAGKTLVLGPAPALTAGWGFSESDIRSWIAEGSLFQGTIGLLAVDGMQTVTNLPLPVTAADTGLYWIAGEDFDIVWAGHALDGEHLGIGDWLISLGDPTKGMQGWAIIHGDLLTKARGDVLYGVHPHSASEAYTQGTLVSHEGALWRALVNIPINTPWDASNFERETASLAFYDSGGDPTVPWPPVTADFLIDENDNKLVGYAKNDVWYDIAEVIPGRGTVSYITDTDPVAPFDNTNGYGFGLGNVVPDPSVRNPAVDDLWINYSNGHMGIFTGPAPGAGGGPAPPPPTGVSTDLPPATLMLPALTGTVPGEVLTVAPGPAIEWRAAATSPSTLVGVIAATNTEQHEYNWADVAGGLTGFPVGGYFIVEHVPQNGKVPGNVGAVGNRDVSIGDWLVVIDADGDGAPDNFHLVQHDRPPHDVARLAAGSAVAPAFDGQLGWFANDVKSLYVGASGRWANLVAPSDRTLGIVSKAMTTWSTSSGTWVKVPNTHVGITKHFDEHDSYLICEGRISGFGEPSSAIVQFTFDISLFGTAPGAGTLQDTEYYFNQPDIHQTIGLLGGLYTMPAGQYGIDLYARTTSGWMKCDANDWVSFTVREVPR